MPPGERETSFVDLLEVIIAHAGGVDELASATEVSPATLARWRRGGYPTKRVRKEVKLVNGWAKQNIENYPPEGFPPTGLPGYIETRVRKEEVDSTDEVPGQTDDSENHATARRRWPALVVGGGAVLVVLLILAIVYLTSSPTNPPPSPPASPPPTGRLVTVQNKIATGPTDLLEDRTPSYLSTQPAALCANRGCKIGGTDVYSNATLTATCRTQGEVVTNADKTSPGITTNPGAVTSNLWLHVTNPTGESGYISVACLVSGDRSAAGLPGC